MSVYTGKVVNGMVLVNGVLLPEGAKVTVLVDDLEDEFFLTPEMQALLEKSIAQADRGEGVPAKQFLAELRARTSDLRKEVAS
jgi:hypothetical protein